MNWLDWWLNGSIPAWFLGIWLIDSTFKGYKITRLERQVNRR